MANLSLRAYNREISNLIDRGQTDEAIAHCEYILQTYPKYIETYRLLGKAYLEGQHHPEALDVFQRVLTVSPDDFITHVGMSIIREEENNLPAAIFHMERAFEVQPSNQAIQDELKHLYGKRDGEEPQKIRLTRGALCRMYARGNQFRQAVAEIKSLLNDSPERVDLEVLLCRMYYNLNMKIEASDLCGKLLNKFPHCLEANRIMMKILMDSGKKSETDSYKQRITNLDPYEDMVSEQFQSSEQVPEDMVSIEKMVYDPNQPLLQTGVQSSVVEKQEVAPDWVVSDLTGDNSDLGEKGFTRILDSSIVSPSEDLEQTEAVLIVPENKDLPPSLPTEAVNEKKQTESIPDKGKLIEGNLERLNPAGLDEVISTSTQQVEMEPISDELPDWLKETEKSTADTESEIPDWLKESGWAAAGSIDQNAPPSAVIHIKDEKESADVPIVPAEIPDWVQGLAPVSEEADIQAEPVAAPSEEISEEASSKLNEWLSGKQQPVDETAAGGTASLHLPNEDEETGSPEWLKGLDNQSPLQDQPAAFTLETQAGGQPDVSSPPSGYHQSPQTEKLDMEDTFPTSGGTSILSPDDVPDWLQDLTSTPESDEPKAASIPKLASLEEPTQPTRRPVEPAPEIVTTTLPPEDVAPDWLSELPLEPNDKTTATLPEDSEDLKGAMPSWLSMLDQDSSEEASESQLVTPTQAEKGDIESDTIQAEEEISAEDKPTTSILPPNPEEGADELPDWLKELDGYPEGTSPITDATQGANDEFPDWLQSFSDSEPVEQTPITPASLDGSSEEKTAGDGDVPDWLSDLDLKGSSVESTVVEVPDWLKGLSPEPGSEATAEVTPKPVEDEAQIVAEGNIEIPLETTVSEAALEITTDEPVMDISETAVEPETKEPILETLAGVGAVSNIPEMESEGLETSIEEAEVPIEPEFVTAKSEEELEQVPSDEAVAPELVATTIEEETLEPASVEDSVVDLTEESEPGSSEVSPKTGERQETHYESVVVDEPAVAEVASVIAEETSENIAQVDEDDISESEFAAPDAQIEAESSAVNVSIISNFIDIEPVQEVEDVAEINESDLPQAITESAEIPVEEQQSEIELEPLEFDQVFNKAKQSLDTGDFGIALDQLNKLIKAEKHLDKIVEKLTNTVEQNPTDFGLWMTLGDALGRSGKLQKALDAYSKAEEYLQ